MFAFHPPWNECIAEGCIRVGDEKVRPPQPPNAHPSSIKTPADYPKEVERRAKAKAKREKRAAKADKIEAENVTLTQQDVEKKRERATSSKASGLKKNTAAASDAAKPRRKALAKRSKKAANSSDDGGYSSDSEEEGPEENCRRKMLKKFSMTERQSSTIPLKALPRLFCLQEDLPGMQWRKCWCCSYGDCSTEEVEQDLYQKKEIIG